MKLFHSSTGFLLPAGSVRRPEASVVRIKRWQGLREAERQGFAPPDGCLHGQWGPPRQEAGPAFHGPVIDPRPIWEV